jgi:hypothetical protein
VKSDIQNLTLAIEDVSSKPLAHGHAQVDIEADSGDAHARVILVLGEQEGVVVVMVVTGMVACLRMAGHGGRSEVSFAMDGGRPVKQGRAMVGVWREVLGAFSLCLRAEDAHLGRVSGSGRPAEAV